MRVAYNLAPPSQSVESPQSNGKENERKVSLERLSLHGVHERDLLCIKAGAETHKFWKIDESQGALYGWEKLSETRDGELDYPIELTILEPNKSGTSFLTSSTVLQQGYELGLVRPGSSQPNICKNLGVVSEITLTSAASVTAKDLGFTEEEYQELKDLSKAA